MKKIEKKRYSLFLVIMMMLVFCFTGFKSSTISDSELRTKLAENNTIKEIVDYGEWVDSLWYSAADINYYFASGPDNFVYYVDDAGWEKISDNGLKYGFVAYTKKPIVYAFDDELYEYYLSTEGSAYTKYTDEVTDKIIERTDTKDCIYLSITSLKENYSDEYYSINGVNPDDVKEVIAKCEINPDNYRIKVQESYVILPDGSEKLLIKGIMNFHNENPVKERCEEMKELFFGGECHTITIIVGNGTEREAKYSTTANKNVYLDAWISDVDKKYNMYLDKEYTIPYETPDGDDYIPFNKDLVLYMK